MMNMEGNEYFKKKFIGPLSTVAKHFLYNSVILTFHFTAAQIPVQIVVKALIKTGYYRIINDC
jgi:hypothetical protein